ncbi:sensor histidine kinase [Gryllotalpicola ginsengisoli]|uniref:sensor histidine kinase n=1 Tax=Gryllotalpicola ginsengisoli TaxID=444608 RepID=UPI0003B771DC|nr:ATP-binding protein [Gryllotalpicola ginsengisoli]
MADSPRPKPGPAPRAPRRDAVFVLVAGVLSGCFALSIATQTATLQAMYGTGSWPDFLMRLGVNLLAGGVSIVLAVLVRVTRLTWERLAAAIVGIAIVSSAIRVGLQWLVDIEIENSLLDAGIEWAGAGVLLAVTLFAGWIFADVVARLEGEAQRSAQQAERAAGALDALQAEELRVRREVADGLHGSVQQALVLLGARLQSLEQQLASDVPGKAVIPQIGEVRAELDQLREVGVRELSRMLRPEGLDLGLVHATRIMMRRVPATIAVELSIAPELAEIADAVEPDTGKRLIVMRFIEEALSNALRHGHASRLALTMSLVRGTVVRVEFEDDGRGIPEGAELRGLARLRSRFEAMGGSLEVGRSRRLGGTRLLAEMPGEPAWSPAD